MKPSKILSKKTVYKSKYFQVDQVELAKEGQTFAKDFIKREPHVMILPLTANNEIYLVREYRDVYQKELLEVVVGFMEKGEDPADAAKRELKEETGLTAARWKKLTELHISPNMESTAHVFIAQDLEEGIQELDRDEEIELVKMPFDEVIEKVMLGEIQFASHIAVLLLVDKLRKEGKLTL